MKFIFIQTKISIMLKHLLKACGILSLVFMASTDVIGQTNFTITNDNADCPVDSKYFMAAVDAREH